MGCLTLVLLNNDRCNEWEKDPELGRKIAIGMNFLALIITPLVVLPVLFITGPSRRVEWRRRNVE